MAAGPATVQRLGIEIDMKPIVQQSFHLRARGLRELSLLAPGVGGTRAASPRRIARNIHRVQPAMAQLAGQTADQQPCNQSDTNNGQRMSADLIARRLRPFFFHGHEIVVLCVQRVLRIGRGSARAVEQWRGFGG